MPSAVADRYRRLAATVTDRVASVDPGRWGHQSPCAEWDARGVVGHLVDTHGMMAGWVGITLGPGPDVADDPVGAWAAARDAMQAVLDDPEQAQREFDGLFGRTTLEATVDRFLCFDLLVHGWDLARATGLDERLDPEEVRRVHAEARQLGDNIRRPGVCGPEVSVAADADEQTRLLAFLGRTV
jgi:uncharacterized protein (TIGR03086 family)